MNDQKTFHDFYMEEKNKEEEEKKKKRKRKRKIAWTVAGAILTFFVFMMVVGYIASTNPKLNRPKTTITTLSLTSEEIKASAKTITYDELMRNSKNYVGETIYFKGEVAQVIQGRENNFDIRVYTKSSFSGFLGDDIYVSYKGERKLEDDIIELWGTYRGLMSYETIFGAKRTIPQIDSLILEVVQKAGER